MLAPANENIDHENEKKHDEVFLNTYINHLQESHFMKGNAQGVLIYDSKTRTFKNSFQTLK